jgi:hypothetical protein
MHSTIIYLINLDLLFIFSATCFGNNFAPIKGGYFKLHDNGKVVAETCRGENELETKVH